MLSKDLTPNPKAVNIIRPSHNSNNNNNSNFQHPPAQLNYSSSSDSSTSFTFANTTASTHHITLSPMIRQPSMESNPGLSFFCQTAPKIHSNKQQQPLQQPQLQQPQLQKTSFEKIQAQPLVISRINLTHRKPVAVADLDDIDDAIDDSKVTAASTEKKNTNSTTEDYSATNMMRVPSFKPGFGMMNGTAGLGSFLLRGNITALQPVVDEARVYRKIEDLEIEKKSLLTLNHTLETVVKEQSNTISDLQDRLAAIERPLTPGLDTSLSKNGIMSCADILGSDDLERCLEDEEAAFERIRIMLVDLIEQAQSAVTTIEVKPEDDDVFYRVKRSNHGYVRPRSVAGDHSNLAIPNRSPSRRVSLGSIHNINTNTPPTNINHQRRLSSSPTTAHFVNSSNTTSTRQQLSSSPTTSPIPNRRYSIQRSVSRSSSPALKKSSSNSSMQSASSRTSTTSATRYVSKYNLNKNQDSQQPQQNKSKKWLN